MIKRSKVVFANDNLEKEFYSLDENDIIKKFIKRSIKDIQENALCGIRIPKRLIPSEYIKRYKITNLWKYDLPNGWRLIYSITTPDKVEIISVILEWFNHPDYEKRFGY